MDWDKLRIFYAVAQAGSFTRAGENLNLSQSAVSRQVSALEDSINVSLFHRHARGLILTEQGDILYQTVKDIYTKLAIAENALTESKDRPKGPLRIAAQLSLGTIWLMPLIDEFIELYPDIAVTLIVEEHELDLSMREADVAIRLFPPKQPDLVHRHLTSIHSGIFAATDYLQRAGVPSRLEELDQHRLIAFAEDQKQPFAEANWLLKADAKPGLPRKATLRVNTMIGVLKAVEMGMGIAALPLFMVQHSTNVTRILEHVKAPVIDAHFVYPSELRNSKRLKVFRDFVLHKVAETAF